MNICPIVNRKVQRQFTKGKSKRKSKANQRQIIRESFLSIYTCTQGNG